MVTTCTLFLWFNLFKCQGWYPNMFSRPKSLVLNRLSIIERIAFSACIFIYDSLTLNQKVSNLWIGKYFWASFGFQKQLEASDNSIYFWKICLSYFFFVRKYLLDRVMTESKVSSQLLLSEDASWPIYY